jgi:histidyl-tRNA synthetase
VFEKDYVIKINNRKVLKGLTEKAGVPDSLAFECFRAIDKLDKIGRDGVLDELRTRRIGKSESDFLLDAIAIKGSGVSALDKFRDLLIGSEIGIEGVDELVFMAEIFEDTGVKDVTVFDMSLARGLDYYTGPVFEGRYLGEPDVGSILGGGRYDHLIEKFGGPSTPATGISLGIGRMIEVVMARGIGKDLVPRLDVYIAPLKRSMVRYAMALQEDLVKQGATCEVDIMDRPLKRSLEEADIKNARLTVIVGERDMQNGEVSIRNMADKSTEQVKFATSAKFIKKALRTRSDG